jgi:preprotein translocase SecE subunit
MKKEIQENKKMTVTQKTDLFADKEAQTTLEIKKKESFIQGLKNELAKVSWTSKKELKTLTKTVLLSTVFFGLGIYAVDLVIKQCLFGIHALARLVFGA